MPTIDRKFPGVAQHDEFQSGSIRVLRSANVSGFFPKLAGQGKLRFRIAPGIGKLIGMALSKQKIGMVLWGRLGDRQQRIPLACMGTARKANRAKKRQKAQPA